MKEIDSYIDSLYKDVNDKSNEIFEMKSAMKAHLLESVNELKREGNSEYDSIKIAISRFGELTEIKDELSKVVDNSKKNNRFSEYLYKIAIFILCLFSIWILSSFNKINELKGSISIILIPLYVVIRFNKLRLGIDEKHRLNIKDEIYRLFLVVYVAFFIGNVLFPISFNSNEEIQVYMNIVPFNTITKHVGSENYGGFFSMLIFRRIIRNFILFIPFGFITPLVNDYFKNFTKCILLVVFINAPVIIIQLLAKTIGISVGSSILINIDYLLINTSGLLLGYFMYKIFENKYNYKY